MIPQTPGEKFAKSARQSAIDKTVIETISLRRGPARNAGYHPSEVKTTMDERAENKELPVFAAA
jgi:hypothetical protein